MASPEETDAIARRAISTLIFLRGKGLTGLEACDVLSAALLMVFAEEERPAAREEMREMVGELAGLMSSAPSR